jgi:hypothetical protein
MGRETETDENQNILNVPHFIQEQPMSCVSASTRMVLSYSTS